MEISKNLLNILFTAIFACTCAQFTSEINGAIPEYIGLYWLFTKDGDAARNGHDRHRPIAKILRLAGERIHLCTRRKCCKTRNSNTLE